MRPLSNNAASSHAVRAAIGQTVPPETKQKPPASVAHAPPLLPDANAEDQSCTGDSPGHKGLPGKDAARPARVAVLPPQAKQTSGVRHRARCADMKPSFHTQLL